MVDAKKTSTQEEIMSVNVNTENVTDATVQVHIAFESAARRGRYSQNGRRNSRARNNAGIRGHNPRNLRTGKNRAVHRSSAKSRRFNNAPRVVQRRPLALPAPQPKSPA